VGKLFYVHIDKRRRFKINIKKMENKGAKVGIVVGVLAAVGIGGYFLWNYLKPKAMLPTQKEEGTNVSNSSTNNNSGSTSSSRFKNKAEGNHFRNWVNDTYPAYAAALKGDGLDRDGSYDNAHIRQAYEDYGAAYDIFFMFQ